LLILPQVFRAEACRYEEHSYKFLLQKTMYRQVIMFYATTDCPQLLEKVL